MRFAVLFIIAVAVAVAAAGADNDDTIYPKTGAPFKTIIEDETETDLKNHRAVIGPILAMKRSGVDHWTYAEMADGYWPKAVEARDRGRYNEAGDYFQALAATGSRKWQKVYGAFYEGDARELAGNFAAAADCFKQVVDGFGADKPEARHRLWLEACYRRGYNLARAKKVAEAGKVADELVTLAGKEDNNTKAMAIAYGIRAVVADSDNDTAKVIEMFKKASGIRRTDEPDLWFHLNMFYADAMRRAKKAPEAQRTYKMLMNELANDPVRTVQAALGNGLMLIETDKDEALTELLKLDTLPFGSIEQKCEARYQAGKLMWEKSQAYLEKLDLKDEARVGFQKDLERTARLLLNCAANSTAVGPSKNLAKTFLEGLPADPESKPEEKLGGGKDAAAQPTAVH